MSIRKKLILSFVLVLILPYIIGRLFFAYGVDLFFGDNSYIKEQLRANFWEASYLISDVHRDFNVQINKNPDVYLNPNVFKGEDIPHDLVGFVVKKDNLVVNKSQLFDEYSEDEMESITLSWGEKYEPKYVNGQESKTGFYPFVVSDFYFSDGSRGSIQIFVSKEYYKDNFEKVYKMVGMGIMAIVGLVLLIVSYMLMRDINTKLKGLEDASDRISSGDFGSEVTYVHSDEFKSLYESFEAMRAKLHWYREMGIKMSFEREQMISSVSHDIRTPITAIRGYVQGIRDGVANSDEKRDEYLRIIHEKTIDIEDMIKDLREMSSLELKKNNYNYQKISINEFVRDFSEEMSFDIESIGGTVTSSILPDEVFVMVDPIKLRRVFMNIYENSKKYRSERNLAINITEYVENDYVRIDIEDNGIGIAKKDTRLVFDRFFRADRSRNMDVPGSGLGLSICKEIMDKHEGGISIRSEKKQGTRVTVSLRIWDGD